jgi:choline dehydrogenase-like flavoprotein
VALGNWRVNKNKEIMEAAGPALSSRCTSTRRPGNACHQHGTARMGNDPAKSVLDKSGRAHDVDNLYVLDRSGFPTGPGVNPTLTIMANAWRCAEHLIESHANGRPTGA